MTMSREDLAVTKESPASAISAQDLLKAREVPLLGDLRLRDDAD